MMDEHQSPSSNKKRKSAVALPSQKRCIIKKTKIAGDLAGTCAALSDLSQSRKFSFNSSPTSFNQTARIPSAKNAKASPAPSAASHSRDLTTPTRVSSRVSRPTFKKKASLSLKKPRLPDSDGTPPLSIILPAPSRSLKHKKPTSSPTKRLAGNNTPSKRKWLDPNPIELTSSDDDKRPQPPRKRIKHTHEKRFSSEVIDLCSESEDVIASPRHTCTRDKGSVVLLSSDEEADLEFPRKIDTRESPALLPIRDISPPIEIESVFQASPSPLAHNAKAPVSEEHGVTNENNIDVEKVNPPQGSLQVLYNEALARCTREPRREKDIADQPSPFFSLKCVPSARTIRYATQTQSPSLHTPLFFNRIIHRLMARLKQPKTLDAKAFSDVRESYPNPKTFSDAAVFSAVSNDTGLNSMDVSKLSEDQDTLTYPDAVMEISAVENDTSSDTQVASISPSILVNDMDLIERLVSRSLGSPSSFPYQESPLQPEVAIHEDTPNLQGQRALTNCSPTTTDSANSFAISPCSTLSNSDAINYPIEIQTPQEAETSFLFGKENCVDQVDTIEPIVQSFVQALQGIYDSSTFYSNPSAAFEPQEFLFCSNPFPSPIDVSFFDIDMSELDLQTMMSNMYGEDDEDDDDDDDISISAMELAYPEESNTI